MEINSLKKHLPLEEQGVVESGDGLGKVRCRKVLIVWKLVEQGLTVLAVRAGEAVWLFFVLAPIISFFFSRLDIDSDIV